MAEVKLFARWLAGIKISLNAIGQFNINSLAYSQLIFKRQNMDEVERWGPDISENKTVGFI